MEVFIVGSLSKKLKTLLLSGALACSMLLNPMEVNAANQYYGDYFGIGLDYFENDKMEKADGWSNGGMFNCTWRASNISFSGGNMNITISNNGSGGYNAGEYRTKQTFGYGMYDVKMKPIKNDGVVSSFFTYTGPSDGTVWDEIDIEFLGKDTTKVQFNYYTKGVGNHEYLYDLGFDASKSFHQYGFLWLPGRITWYVDGKAVYTATENIPTTPGKIMMNAWPGTGVDEWLNRYNGVAPLTAQYEWASFTKVDTGSSQTGNSGSAASGASSFDSSKTYKIISKNSGKALDLAWGSPDNGANILQYSYYGYTNQKWYITKLSNGYYTIKNAASGKVLDVAGGSYDNGANVLQWSYGGGANQEWSIEPVGGGYYKIINRQSGKALDVEGKSSADNANVLQWAYNGGANQLWKIDIVY